MSEYEIKKKPVVYGSIIVVIVAIFIMLIAIFSMFIIIGPGEVGVKFNPFAEGVQSSELTEGFHIKAPWVHVDKYNVKTQDYTMTKAGTRDERIRTVTKEGLYVDLDITVLYKIDSTKADEIRRTIGKDGQYQEIIIRSMVRSAVREIVSNYNAMDIYGEKRPMVEQQMYDKLAEQLLERNIIAEKILLRDVELPKELSVAIEAKKTAEQEVLKMEYILETEKLEKERKVIEAEGISSANIIIGESISQEYLSWYWIDNLDKHESVIYVPIDESGMPLFKQVS